MNELCPVADLKIAVAGLAVFVLGLGLGMLMSWFNTPGRSFVRSPASHNGRPLAATQGQIATRSADSSPSGREGRA